MIFWKIIKETMVETNEAQEEEVVHQDIVWDEEEEVVQQEIVWVEDFDVKVLVRSLEKEVSYSQLRTIFSLSLNV